MYVARGEGARGGGSLQEGTPALALCIVVTLWGGTRRDGELKRRHVRGDIGLIRTFRRFLEKQSYVPQPTIASDDITSLLFRGTTVNRTYGEHKTYIFTYFY